MRSRLSLPLALLAGLLASVLITATPGSAAGTSAIQTGVLTFVQPDASSWFSVTFDEAFDVEPVVVMGPISSADADAAVMRVRNVTTTGFEYQLAEWDHLDGTHPQETTTWIAALPGQHDLRKMTVQALSVELDHQWQTVSLAGFDAAPVVFGSVSSDNDPTVAAIRIRNVTATSVQLRLQEQELNDLAGETRDVLDTVSVMAFSEGSTTEDGLALVVGRTGNTVTHAYTTISARSRGVTGLLGDMQTYDGPNTAAVRYRNLGSESVDLKVEEDVSRDTERNHTTEVMGWLLITSW